MKRLVLVVVLLLVCGQLLGQDAPHEFAAEAVDVKTDSGTLAVKWVGMRFCTDAERVAFIEANLSAEQRRDAITLAMQDEDEPALLVVVWRPYINDRFFWEYPYLRGTLVSIMEPLPGEQFEQALVWGSRHYRTLRTRGIPAAVVTTGYHDVVLLIESTRLITWPDCPSQIASAPAITKRRRP